MPPVLWGLLIIALSSIPNPPIPAATPGGTDKVVHFMLYAVLGALLTKAHAAAGFKRGSVREATYHVSAGHLVRVIALAAVFAVLDESYQSFIPGRRADAGDFIADLAGAATGALYIMARRRQEHRSCP